jgi:AraC-like DNA-binding protein
MHPLIQVAKPRLVEHDTFVRLVRSRDFLAANLGQRMKLADAARIACLSPFHYHRMFARAFGETPHEFLTRRRLERAKELLANQNASVTDICLEIGYSSLGTFSSGFTAVYGYSPSDYRRNVRRIFRSGAVVPARFIPTCLLRWWQTSQWPQNSKIQEASGLPVVPL